MNPMIKKINNEIFILRKALKNFILQIYTEYDDKSMFDKYMSGELQEKYPAQYKIYQAIVTKMELIELRLTQLVVERTTILTENMFVNSVGDEEPSKDVLSVQNFDTEGLEVFSMDEIETFDIDILENIKARINKSLSEDPKE